MGIGRRAAPLHHTLDDVFIKNLEGFLDNVRPEYQAGRRLRLGAALLKVEVELKSILRLMPFGVFTYPQLRRELRRCVELGEPWPFVLAVIPTPSRKAKSPAPQAAMTSAITALSWPASEPAIHLFDGASRAGWPGQARP